MADGEREGRSRRGRRHPFRNHRVLASLVLGALLLGAHGLLVQWVDRPSAFLSALAVTFLLLLLLDWVLDLVGPRIWTVARSLVTSVARAVANDPEVNRLLDRHPRAGRVIRERFTLGSWTGTYLTVTVLLALYFLWQFLVVARGIGPSSVLAASDPRVSALLRAFRAPSLTHLMWWSTLVGDGRVLAPLTFAVLALLLLWGKRSHALALGVTMALGPLAVNLLKYVAERPRPPVALALIKQPSSFSFPSGHAFSSLLFFGMIAFIVFDVAKTVRVRLGVLLLAVVGTLFVGLSRVYLGVHWMTDVLASWALALAWLSATVGAFLMWRRYDTPPADAEPHGSRSLRVGLAFALVALALVAVIQGAEQDPLLHRALTPSARSVELSSTVGARGLPTLAPGDVGRLPRFSEKLDGTRQSPVGVVFVGTREQLVSAFRSAGWTIAEQPGPLTLLRASVAAIADEPYGTAPVTPSFVAGQVQDVAFQKAVGRASARRRHHARFWRTRFDLDGTPVWVATASLDAGIGVGSAIRLPTHRIDPDIDAERDYIARDVARTRRVSRAGTVRVCRPTVGTNAAGDPFFTGGLAVVLVAR